MNRESLAEGSVRVGCIGVLPDHRVNDNSCDAAPSSRGRARARAPHFKAHGLLRKRPSMLSGPGPLATSNKNPPAIERFLRKLII